jgi:hypothetical protein
VTSELLNPLDFPQNWDVIIIAGVSSPGICTISDPKRTHEWDVKKGKGTVGATITFVQKPPAKFSVTFEFWTRQHFTDWANFRALLKYDPSKKTVQATDIFHPALSDIDITSVVVESIGGIVHKGGQKYEVTVEFLEYFPAATKNAPGTPTQAKSVSDTGTPTGQQPASSTDTDQQTTAALLKQAQAP